MPGNLLLTGAPGVGKTTVLRRVAARLERPFAGFLTGEVREGGRRPGVLLEGFGDERAVLARAGAASPHRIGRYAVDVAALDRIVGTALAPGAGLYLIDEIGPMECLSARFQEGVRGLLDGDARVVATIHRKAGGFVAEVKARPDVELWEVTPANRDALPARVLRWIGEARAV